jgi:hypothetical protein
MAPERTVVQGQDGFLFVPRYDLSSVRLDRVLVPVGSNPEGQRQVVTALSKGRPSTPVTEVRLGESGGTAYDASLADIARIQNTTVALATGRTLFYPVEPAQLAGMSWSITGLVTLVALGLLGAAAVFGASRLRLPRPRRAHVQPTPRPA